MYFVKLFYLRFLNKQINWIQTEGLKMRERERRRRRRRERERERERPQNEQIWIIKALNVRLCKLL